MAEKVDESVRFKRITVFYFIYSICRIIIYFHFYLFLFYFIYFIFFFLLKQHQPREQSSLNPAWCEATYWWLTDNCPSPMTFKFWKLFPALMYCLWLYFDMQLWISTSAVVEKQICFNINKSYRNPFCVDEWPCISNDSTRHILLLVA